MNKTIRYTVAFLLLVEFLALLAPSLTSKALQKSYFPGVSPGESFTYGTSDGSPWVSMTPSDVQPLPRWDRFTSLLTVNFTIISDSNLGAPATQIMFNETIKYRNGTISQMPKGTVDVDTGGGAGSTFFIASQLGQGDLVYPDAGANFTYTINETTTNPNWAGRQVCVLNYTRTQRANESLAAQRTTAYWDQQTGVLLAAYEAADAWNVSMGTEIYGHVLYELIANNVGIPMDYPRPMDMTPIYIAIAIGAAVVVGFVIVRTATSKPKKKHKRLEAL